MKSAVLPLLDALRPFVPMRRPLDGPRTARYAILNSPLSSMQITLSCCSLFSQRCFSEVDFLWSVTGNRFRAVKSPLVDIHSMIILSGLTGLIGPAAHFCRIPTCVSALMSALKLISTVCLCFCLLMQFDQRPGGPELMDRILNPNHNLQINAKYF